MGRLTAVALARIAAASTVLLACLVSCRPRPAPVPAVDRPPRIQPSDDLLGSGPPPPRDDGRLSRTVTPRRYALSLRIDPALPRFSGVTTIDVDVPEPTRYVVMHGRDLTISRALAHLGSTEVAAKTSARVAAGGVRPEELVLTFVQPLPAGRAVVELAYDAPFAADLAGLYRVIDGGRPYAFTQFEAVDARRAFPCFDEPAYKTPFDVAIAAPRGMAAVSNMPEASLADAADGMVTHTFRTSPPLPSYLAAFAVGDFDFVTGAQSPVPVRVVTTKGRAGLSGLALDVAPALLAKLGDYFALPYPYPKLDLVAVPDFAAGAMENPGLVTFRDTLLLLDPRRASTAARRRQAETIAHEFAHQWFGDLVTIEWWDDLWLNEGFATWAEAKIVDDWRPSFGATVEQVADAQGVMDTDALHSARAVRGAIRSTGEAMEAFDGITYTKGAAVLRMIEDWLSPAIFRRGVQRYLRENAWKNARAEDLFGALDFVSAQKVAGLASDFLDHPGVPEVLASWTCSASGGSKIELRPSEWRPLGSGSHTPRTWTLPVCVESEGPRAKSCFTLGTEPITRDLAPGCPSWVHPNAQLAGYYRFVVDRPALLALARAAPSLSSVDRLGLVANAWAGVRQGALAPSTLLEMLPLFDGELERPVIDQLVGSVRGMDEALIEEEARPAFQKFVAARFAGKKRALGWEPSSGSRADDERALARRSVLWAMGETAADATTLDEAEKYAARWLKDPTSVSNEIASVAVPLASRRAPGARLADLRAAAKAARTPEDRTIAIRAMGTFDDPAVLREALDLTLTDELRLSEIGHVFGSAAGRRTSRAVLFGWEKENWGKLQTRLPGSFGRGMLVGVAAGLCTGPQRDEARAFFTAGIQGVEGVQRSLDEALEASALCIALREHAAAEVTAYLMRK